MFRKELIDLLLGNPMTVTRIARSVGESPGQIADDLSQMAFRGGRPSPWAERFRSR